MKNSSERTMQFRDFMCVIEPIEEEKKLRSSEKVRVKTFLLITFFQGPFFHCRVNLLFRNPAKSLNFYVYYAYIR